MALEIHSGQELSALVVESVDPEKIKLMTALLRDPNPIHFDAESVRELGLGDRIINQGPCNLSYVVEMIVRWAGGPEAIRSISSRFLGNVRAGDRVECQGRVVKVDRAASIAMVEAEAFVDGATVVRATVGVALEEGR